MRTYLMRENGYYLSSIPKEIAVDPILKKHLKKMSKDISNDFIYYKLEFL
jgi:hypothetical protein